MNRSVLPFPATWVNPKKIAPILLASFRRDGRNTVFGFQLDAESMVLFFDKNANPPDTIPEALHRYKRENLIIVQIDVPSGKALGEMVRVFTCKEPELDQRDIDGLWRD